MPPGQNGVFQMSRISEWTECKQGLGQRCQDDKGSYTQCCEITWMKHTSLDCVSLSFWLRSWPTCSSWEALHFQKTLGSPCAVFISSDTMPGTLGSARHENNGFLSLEGDWNVCCQAQQLAAVFTDQSGEQGIPSQYPRGLELDGTWGCVCVCGRGWVAVSSTELSYSQLFAFPVEPWVFVVLFSSQMNSYAESYVWGQVQWSRWRTGGPSQYPTPPHAPWLDTSQNLLYTLIVWM